MATKGEDGRKSGSRQDQRASRLEKELRANLKKRKDQARTRSEHSGDAMAQETAIRVETPAIASVVAKPDGGAK